MHDPVRRLSDAGLIDAGTLNEDDVRLLTQLSEEEVAVLIQIATRLYPDAPGAVKLADLRQHGGVRLLVPL